MRAIEMLLETETDNIHPALHSQLTSFIKLTSFLNDEVSLVDGHLQIVDCRIISPEITIVAGERHSYNNYEGDWDTSLLYVFYREQVYFHEWLFRDTMYIHRECLRRQISALGQAVTTTLENTISLEIECVTQDYYSHINPKRRVEFDRSNHESVESPLLLSKDSKTTFERWVAEVGLRLWRELMKSWIRTTLHHAFNRRPMIMKALVSPLGFAVIVLRDQIPTKNWGDDPVMKQIAYLLTWDKQTINRIYESAAYTDDEKKEGDATTIRAIGIYPTRVVLLTELGLLTFPIS